MRAQFIPRKCLLAWLGREILPSLSLPILIPIPIPCPFLSHPHPCSIPILMRSDSYSHFHPHPCPILIPMLSDPYSLPLLLSVHQTHTELGEMQAVLVQALLPGQPIQSIAAARASRHCRKEIFYYLGLLCLSELMLGRANDAPHMVSLLPVHHQK